MWRFFVTLFNFKESIHKIFLLKYSFTVIVKFNYMIKSKTPWKCLIRVSAACVAKRVKASFLRRPWLHYHGLNPHPGHVVASLDKTLYDDYLCLVDLNKQQIYVVRNQRSTGKLGKCQLLSRCGFDQRIAHGRFLVKGGKRCIYQSIKRTVSTGCAKSHAPKAIQ